MEKIMEDAIELKNELARLIADLKEVGANSLKMISDEYIKSRTMTRGAYLSLKRQELNENFDLLIKHQNEGNLTPEEYDEINAITYMIKRPLNRETYIEFLMMYYNKIGNLDDETIEQKLKATQEGSKRLIKMSVYEYVSGIYFKNAANQRVWRFLTTYYYKNSKDLFISMLYSSITNSNYYNWYLFFINSGLTITDLTNSSILGMVPGVLAGIAKLLPNFILLHKWDKYHLNDERLVYESGIIDLLIENCFDDEDKEAFEKHL